MVYSPSEKSLEMCAVVLGATEGQSLISRRPCVVWSTSVSRDWRGEEEEEEVEVAFAKAAKEARRRRARRKSVAVCGDALFFLESDAIWGLPRLLSLYAKGRKKKAAKEVAALGNDRSRLISIHHSTDK